MGNFHRSASSTALDTMQKHAGVQRSDLEHSTSRGLQGKSLNPPLPLRTKEKTKPRRAYWHAEGPSYMACAISTKHAELPHVNLLQESMDVRKEIPLKTKDSRLGRIIHHLCSCIKRNNRLNTIDERQQNMDQLTD